jgi:hypothetical protein
MFSRQCLIWATDIGSYNADYNELLEQFREDFLGLDAQRKIRQELEGGSFIKSNNNSSMGQYFLNIRAKLKRLEHPVTDEEFLMKISKHFNETVENLITNLLYQPRAVSKAFRILKRLDEKELSENKNRYYNSEQNRNNYYQNKNYSSQPSNHNNPNFVPNPKRQLTLQNQNHDKSNNYQDLRTLEK